MTVAKDLNSQGRKKEAIAYLLKKIAEETKSDRAIPLAEYGAQLAHLETRDYHSAAKFYQYISNYSTSSAKQLSALKYLGSIYFDHFKDFELAISIYENVLRSAKSVEEKAKYRLLLAKSHYYLAQMDQAEAELASYKELKISESARYEGEVFESNILVSKKMHEEASKILKRLIEKYPERAKS
ncbi:MAG: hypothetical protein GW917_02675, partial [Bdellovibrionales bacterium]|nr:hypothetical protein [Bdellovibrionales bacterium]